MPAGGGGALSVPTPPVSGEAGGGSAAVALRRELEELRNENTKLQDRLCKAKGLVAVFQKQAEEARAERDREHRRAENLQHAVSQLQQKLRREATKDMRPHYSIATPPSTAPDIEGALEDELPGPAALTDHATSDGALHGLPSTAVGKVVASVVATVLPPRPPLAAEGRRGAAAREALGGRTEEMAAAPPGTERSWEFVVQGQHDPLEQADFAPKLVSCFPDDAKSRAWSRGVAYACSRGRRLDASVPNQDDFLIAQHTLAHDGYIALYGVFDGHGPEGHQCAAFARGTLPECLFGEHSLLMKPEDTLRQAFEHTQARLLEQPFDTETSGTTAALALVLSIPGAPPDQEVDGGRGGTGASEPQTSEVWVFVAHVGDSRVVLASIRDDSEAGDNGTFLASALTRDHRPDDQEEAERISQQGGEVRRMHRTTGGLRVFGAGEDRPALALTRSLGASVAHHCGVIAEPEVSAYRLRPGVDLLLLLGTDGLFEFCDENEAVAALIDGATAEQLEALCEESRQRWTKSSYNETVDDITAIAVTLPTG